VKRKREGAGYCLIGKKAVLRGRLATKRSETCGKKTRRNKRVDLRKKKKRVGEGEDAGAQGEVFEITRPRMAVKTG